MKNKFATREIASAIRDLGFNEPCIAFFNTKSEDSLCFVDLFGFISELDDDAYIRNSDSDKVTVPMRQDIIDWFRETHRFHIQINPISYSSYKKTAYFYNINSDDASSPIYAFEDKYEEVLTASKQDVPGHYLNEELYDKNIFDMDFAYKTYEECREKAILKAMEILKQNNNGTN